MPDRKQAPSKVLGILYLLGYFSILFGGTELIQKIRIPSSTQPIIALISAALLFVSVSIFRKFSDETGKVKAIWLSSFGFGLVQVIFAILFWTVAEPETRFTMWLGIYNRFLSVFGLSFFYAAVFQFFFPSLRPTTPEIRPDPLAEYPETVKEIMNKGRNWVIGATLGPILSFFFIGVGGMVVTDSIDVFLISSGLGFLIGFPLGFIVTYKWQSWARETAIPENDLEAAAKAANMWWPKIKEE